MELSRFELLSLVILHGLCSNDHTHQLPADVLARRAVAQAKELIAKLDVETEAATDAFMAMEEVGA